MKQMWEERYSNPEFAYGEEPNTFLKEQLALFKPGTILFPAEGEGRNSVYAATQGWTASAFDISEAGKNKALQLALKLKVSVDYHVGELQQLPFAAEQFDAVALIYAHFPAAIKSDYHRSLAKLLKKGGTLLFEAFSKNHIVYVTRDPKVGGPKDVDMLFSEAELQADFSDFEFLVLEEKVVELHEGLYHNGTGSVIRCVARKK